MSNHKVVEMTKEEMEVALQDPKMVVQLFMGEFVERNGLDHSKVHARIFNKGTQTYWKGRTWTEWVNNVGGIGYETDEFNLVFAEKSTDTIELYMIEAKQRGKGIGTDLMNKVLDLADELGVNIQLVPTPYKNVDDSKYCSFLREWYASFGFKSNFYTPHMTYVAQ
jgi:GNAT superfamily N-acetyltransferase